VSDQDRLLVGIMQFQANHYRRRSADYMQGTRLTFRSKEDAMHFAEKQGQFILRISKHALSNPSLSIPPGWDYYV
jgi:hypothetical protein